MDKWVPEKIQLETSLEAKTVKLKLSYFRHVMRRHGFLAKTTILGKREMELIAIRSSPAYCYGTTRSRAVPVP